MINTHKSKHILLYAILAVHMLWLIVHLFLSSHGWINQWKLSGYGMYTGPSPQPFLEVRLVNENGSALPDRSLRYGRYTEANFGLGLYCVKTTPEKINMLISDNTHLLGRDMHLVVMGRFMRKHPIADSYEIISSTSVRWIDDESYQYEAHVPYCDNKLYGGEGVFVVEKEQ